MPLHRTHLMHIATPLKLLHMFFLPKMLPFRKCLAIKLHVSQLCRYKRNLCSTSFLRIVCELVFASVSATDNTPIHPSKCGNLFFPFSGCTNKRLLFRTDERAAKLGMPIPRAIGNRRTTTYKALKQAGTSSALLLLRGQSHQHTCTSHYLSTRRRTCLAASRNEVPAQLLPLSSLFSQKCANPEGRLKPAATLNPISEETLLAG